MIKNLVNSKVYVGQTDNLRGRWAQHKNHAKILNYPIYKAIRKYGLDQFRFVPLENFNTKDEVNLAEVFWIDLLETRNRAYGYNIKEGGAHGKHSSESLLKMSIIKIGKIATDSTRLKMFKSHAGENNHNFGKVTSQEVKDKISQSVAPKVKGENNPRAKLTLNIITIIREEWATGKFLQRELAEKYGVSRAMIGYIVRNDNWS